MRVRMALTATATALTFLGGACSPLPPPGDTVLPDLSLPGDLTVPATGPNGATVTYSASAIDDVDGLVPITCTPASGTVFALGTHAVDCFASDAAGNTATGAFTVTVLAPPNGAVSIATGNENGQFTCAALGDGTVRCWGANDTGWLGNGTTISSTTPVPVIGITDATAVAAGIYHACALLGSGGVRCWGVTAIGNGTFGPQFTPVAVSGLSNAVAITAGADHMCALKGDGTVSCWGLNWSGQLGTGNTTSATTPQPVVGVSGATAISAGFTHTCALLSDSTVRCWGSNYYGELGNGSTASSAIPVAVSQLDGATAVSAGAGHTCARLEIGTVRCWGRNDSGELGDGTTTNAVTTVSVVGLTDATTVSAGSGQTCALRENGTVVCWGASWVPGVPSPITPTQVPGLGGVNAVDISEHRCVILVGGSVRCWGSNSRGQLGNGTTTTSSTPVAVIGIP